MSDNVLVREDQIAEMLGKPHQPSETDYPLDWQTTEVKLAKGKLSAVLRRPTLEELLERDAELQVPIEMAKDGSYKLPDPTATDELDCKLFDQINTSGGEFPERAKAAFIRGLYKREVYVADSATAFDDQINVLEEIGGDPPAFTVIHGFRQPTEEELRSWRRRMQTGEVRPGKRGRQQFVTRSNLRTAIEFYDRWCIGLCNVRLEHSPSEPDLETLKSLVDPLIKRMVVQEFANFILEALQD